MNAGGVPCSRYYSVREAMDSPPVVERGVLQTVHDASGPFQVTNPAFRFRDSPAHARDSVPELGQHGPELLRGLGLTAAQISTLIEHQVLYGPPERPTGSSAARS
jgi:crotonobetainyl-CoA:carnitine CoA-transferase CaiB-like acyl-CoA transferase